MTPDVSVIITIYNTESYIERAIASAFAQKNVSVEVIAVDDCSTDQSWTILSNIKDQRLKSFRLSQNCGPSVARNTAISYATASWLAILDSDDAFESGRLAKCLTRAKTQKADIIVDNIIVKKEDSGKNFLMFSDSLFSQKNTLNLANFIQGNASVFDGYNLGYLKPIFSSDFLRKHQLSYDPEIRIGEDYLLLAEALAKGAVCAIEPSAGYLYTARTSSISHRLTSQDIKQMCLGDEKLLKRYSLDQKSLKAQKKRAFFLKEAYAFNVFVEAFKAKNYAAAAKAIVSCPSSIRYLREAIWKRISRLISSIAPSKYKKVKSL